MPASNQPVSTMSSLRPFERSTVGPQATLTNNRSTLTDRRISASYIADCGLRIGMWIANPQSAIRNSEDSKLHTLKSLLSRDTAGQKICEVRSAQPDDPRSCVAVSGSESRPIVVALGGDRQPLVRTDGKRTAVR